MPLDLALFSDKLRRYRNQFAESPELMSVATGISPERIHALENGATRPSGDEILIIADHFKCDYKFFISNERSAAFEQTETLFRRWGQHLSKADRWAIQEFLYLCECEQYLWDEMERRFTEFSFTKSGTFYKSHGTQAAAALRSHFGYRRNEIRRNAYSDFRKLGLHIFRRRLENSTISGVFVRHPRAGRCVLVNYVEDVYRQHFTVAHEAGHALLDDDSEGIISFAKWSPEDLSEVRANAFASHYLMPPEFLKSIPDSTTWDPAKTREWAGKLRVSTTALAFALRRAKLVDAESAKVVRSTRIHRDEKEDPELSTSLSPNTRVRWEELLQRGLSPDYVRLCFEAYAAGRISAGRLGEMLRVLPEEVSNLARIVGVQLTYD